MSGEPGVGEQPPALSVEESREVVINLSAPLGDATGRHRRALEALEAAVERRVLAACWRCGHEESEHVMAQDLDGDYRPINAPYESCEQCVGEDQEQPHHAHESRAAALARLPAELARWQQLAADDHELHEGTEAVRIAKIQRLEAVLREIAIADSRTHSTQIQARAREALGKDGERG